MRVLHVHSGNLYGGVETFLRTLARCRTMAPAMDMTVALCFDGRIASELRAEGVATPSLGEVRLRRVDLVWSTRKALEALLRREAFDVVVCHQAWPLALFGSTVKAAGIPLVSWVHMAQTGRHWLDRLAGFTEPDLVICNSRYSASVLPKTTARVETIYYPVMAPSQNLKSGNLKSEISIIQVSRMESWKGHETTLEALGKLRDVPGWSCVQVGGAQRPSEQRYLESLQAMCERLRISDRVQFLGHRGDVAALLANADIFCQPNLEPEPFGICFVEALYAGLPVVSSAIGGALEIVDADCGALVPPGDPTALAEVLARLITDRQERESLGRMGPVRARERCDPGMQMLRIASVLERAAASRPVVH